MKLSRPMHLYIIVVFKYRIKLEMTNIYSPLFCQALFVKNLSVFYLSFYSSPYLSTLSLSLQGGMYGNGPMAGGPNDIRPPVPGAGAAQVQGDNIDAAFAQHQGAQQVIINRRCSSSSSSCDYIITMQQPVMVVDE